MKRFILLTLLTVASFSLAGCAIESLKAPCSPSASLGDSPCGHIPVNLVLKDFSRKTA